MLSSMLALFFTAGQCGVCERVEGGRAATQCDFLVMVLPRSLLAADYTVIDLAHTSTPLIYCQHIFAGQDITLTIIQFIKFSMHYFFPCCTM